MRFRSLSIGAAALLLVAQGAPALATQALPLTASVQPRPQPEIFLGLLQLGAGYAGEVGGILALLEIGVAPKNFGLHSDFANVALVGLVAPPLAGGAVCATGLLSSRYRGHCGTTILGAYAGAAVLSLLGALTAPDPGPDDSAEFATSIPMIIGALLGAPIGAVIAYHATKEPITAGENAPPRSSGAPVPPRAALLGESARPWAATNPVPRVTLPLLGLAW